MVPFLERVLLNEKDEDLFIAGLAFLVSAAVAETREQDEKLRIARTKENKELEEEHLAATPSTEEAAAGGSFFAIRALIIKIATQTPCKDDPFSDSFGSTSARATSSSRDAVLRGLTSPRRQGNGVVSSPVDEADLFSTDTLPVPTYSSHTECRSLRAITSLIAVFSRLAFAPRDSLKLTKATNAPSSLRSITIYRDLLGLLYPLTNDQPDSTTLPVKVPARCPKSRIVILQWLTRFRADSKHRIFFRADIDDLILPFAVTLKRTKESEADAKGESDDTKRRTGRGPRGETSDERGRAPRTTEETTRSRSRSRKASVIHGADAIYNPLWWIPDVLNFEMPPEDLPSEALITYDPDHPLLQAKDVPPVECVCLPVSEYVRVLNGILRGHDWELVSYVLCFLPLQLSNKLYFHGGRSTREVRALLDVLCGGVLGSGGAPPWEKRFNHPAFIRKIDLNAVAYQSLSILISYRGVFTSIECERLIQAFMAGLQGKGEVAKPCLQALTLAIFELPIPIGRHLTTIIDSMKNILSTTGLAVHILEFLLALGQNGNLFRNFTEDQYRLVFVVAIGYIAEHNTRSDQAVKLTVPKSRESFTLSQHVIGMAYYAIYVWFMQLKLPQRENLVREIIRELLNSRSTRVVVDEMAEVCFDWLSRYTYGNADPKPPTSYLSELVMQDEPDGEPSKSQSWLLSDGTMMIITVTSRARTSWVTITTTRPTGVTEIVCKLEDVLLWDMGEANADLASLPAFLMTNRPSSEDIEGSVNPGFTLACFADVDQTPEVTALASVKDNVPPTEHSDSNSQHGFIRATPIQRKDVYPSFRALQLLSSHPMQNSKTPRCRLIPNEDKYQRLLRFIHMTPFIDMLKVAILYVAPGQTTETEILGNIDGSPLYLKFLAGVGRLVRLKGQVDIFLAGLDRLYDTDGEYAYTWWDDLSQMTFHTATMMPPNHNNRKRLLGNDYVKIVYNDSGRDYAFGTIQTAWNFINIVISPHTTGAGNYEVPTDEGWSDWDREDWFKVTLQRAEGIPDFSPLGSHKLVSRRALPIVVRQIAHLANDMAARFHHIRSGVYHPMEVEAAGDGQVGEDVRDS